MNKYTKYFTSCKGVFQGGGCKAIAYIGAYKEAYDRGVFFSELAGTSAGSIIAALVAAGAKPDFLERIIHELIFKDFLRKYTKSGRRGMCLFKYLLPKDVRDYSKYHSYLSFSSFSKTFGIFDSFTIEEVVDKYLKELTGLNRTVLFSDLIPNLHIVCADLETHSVKVWNKQNTPEDSVAKAVRCSCSIPLFFQPVDKRFVDGGILSNLPSFIFTDEPHYNRILNFKLETDENSDKISNIIDYGKSIIDTVIDGSCNIQQKLGSDTYDVVIKINEIKSIDFHKINDDIINSLIKKGADSMKVFLDEEQTFSHNNDRGNRTLYDKEQMRSLVSYISLDKHKEVYVSCDNTFWCWELFLSLVRWVNVGSRITIITTKINPNGKYIEEEKSRRRMLKAIGCKIIEQEKIFVCGYFFGNKHNWFGIIFQEDQDNFIAQHYNNELDSILIKELIRKINKDNIKPDATKMIKIKSVSDNKIINMLKNEPIYENAEMKFEEIKLNRLCFLNPYIRALKYKQIEMMYNLYDEENIDPFSPAALYFNGNKESLIGPPVVEEHNGNLYVIEGNTRCVYAYRHGMQSLKILVIRNVETPLPCDTQKKYRVSDILISDRKLTGEDRYPGFKYQSYRHIEEQLRPYETYML